MDLRSEKIKVADALEAIEMFFERRWTDSLSIVPPTPEKVEALISYVGRDPQEEIGLIPPKMTAATIEKLAINSVMGGCLPQHFPVLLAAVEAVLDPLHLLAGTQTTTHMNEPLIIVNGPVAKWLGVNSGEGVFGRGYRANGVISRALRLILWNLGGNYPGEADKSCFSHPGSWCYCIAENEDASPWEPLHVERGMPLGSNAVTVFSCDPPQSICTNGTIEQDLDVMASCMRTQGNNNFYFMGEMLAVFNPNCATQLGNAGWSKKDVKQYLWEKTKMPVGLRKIQPFVYSLALTHLKEWMARPDDELMPLTETPDHIHIVVAGGNYFNAICHGWGLMGGFAVTKEVKVP